MAMLRLMCVDNIIDQLSNALNIVEKITVICDATVNKKPKNDELLCH